MQKTGRFFSANAFFFLFISPKFPSHHIHPSSLAMVMLTSFVSMLAAVSAVTAAPSFSKRTSTSFKGCQISADPDIPTGQSALSIPSGQKALYVGLGVGVQNYTCSTAGTYRYATNTYATCSPSC